MLKSKDKDKETLNDKSEESWNQTNHLLLYEDATMINRFENRDDFLADVTQLQVRYNAKLKEIALDDQKETLRIIKEFDFRNYDKRFNVDIGTVLAALLGAEKAEKELLKNGMLHNYSHPKKKLLIN